MLESRRGYSANEGRKDFENDKLSRASRIVQNLYDCIFTHPGDLEKILEHIRPVDKRLEGWVREGLIGSDSEIRAAARQKVAKQVTDAFNETQLEEFRGAVSRVGVDYTRRAKARLIKTGIAAGVVALGVGAYGAGRVGESKSSSASGIENVKAQIEKVGNPKNGEPEIGVNIEAR